MASETIRNWHFNQLEFNLKSVEWILRSADAAALTTYRDGGSGWTALEVLCHLRDFEKVFLERVKLTVEQDDPPLPFPKPDEVAAAGNYNAQKFADVLAAWQANRAELLAVLRARSESDWDRIAEHPTRGRLTLLDQLYLTTLHDSNHLEQMTRTLHEKKQSS